MNDHVERLRPAARELVHANRGAKLSYLMADQLIGYPAAKAVENALRELIEYPRCGLLPNILLSGPSRNGKTSVMKRIQKEYANVDAVGSVPVMPIVIVNMPSPPNEKEFWASILRVMLGRVPPRAQTYALKSQALDLIRYSRCRALAIDEFQHVLEGTRRERDQMLGLIKNLSNELEIPLVCLGLPEVKTVLLDDQQYAGRFASFTLPPWQLNGDFRRLVDNFERLLPLSMPSNLSNDENVRLIYDRSNGGLLGWVWLRIREAARVAIEKDAPCIDTALLHNVKLPTFREVYGAQPKFDEPRA